MKPIDAKLYAFQDGNNAIARLARTNLWRAAQSSPKPVAIRASCMHLLASGISRMPHPASPPHSLTAQIVASALKVSNVGQVDAAFHELTSGDKKSSDALA